LAPDFNCSLTVRLVEEAVARRLAATPVDEAIDQIAADRAAAEQRLAELEYEKLVRDVAVRGGVLPRAVDFIVPDVRKLFEVHGNALTVRNGATMPGDPLPPLTIDAWLLERRKDVPFLFGKE
jgi:hypothetical protein